MSQPNPEEQAMQQQAQQAQLQLLQAQIMELQARAAESQADAQEAMSRAQKLGVEAQLLPEEMRVRTIQAISTNLDSNTNDEFSRRAKVAELILKEREIETKEDMVNTQMKVQ
jgi:hypothetical protein